MKHSLNRLFLAFFLFSLVLFSSSVYAQDERIEVSVSEVTSPLETGSFKFEIVSNDPDAPLPENGTTITIQGNSTGIFYFDSDDFQSTETRDYVIRQIQTPDGLSTDQDIFYVKIYSFYEGNDSYSHLVMASSGLSKKSRIAFENYLPENSSETQQNGSVRSVQSLSQTVWDNVKTGIKSPVLTVCLILFLIGSCILILHRLKRTNLN